MSNTAKSLITFLVLILLALAAWQIIARSRAESVVDDGNPLLGGWQKVSDTDSADDFAPAYIGFIEGADGNTMRLYDGASTSTLYDLESWDTAASSSGTILTEYFYGQSGADNIDTQYLIASSSTSMIVLEQLSYDGVPSGGIMTYQRVRSAQDEAGLSFKRTPAQDAAACTAILTGSSSPEMIQVMLPLTCSVPFGPTTAKLSFDQLGNFIMTSGSKTLISLSNAMAQAGSATDSDASIQSTMGGAPFLNLGAITLQDINGDGYPDIVALTSLGAYNAFFEYFLYDPSTGAYEAKPILTDIVNPTVDTQAHTITSNYLGRGLGDLYENDTYTLENGTYVLTRSESQDFASDAGYGSANPLYIRVVQKLIDGAMATTSVERLTARQLGYDFGN